MPRFGTRDLALVAMFAALLAVLGIPGGLSLFGPVPITLQSLGWMLTACLLGPWRAGLTMLVFNALLLAGLPIAAGGAGGFGVFAGPSGGYLIGAMIGMPVTGWLVQRWGRRNVAAVVLACVLGCIVVVYAVGIPWTAWRLGSGLLGVAQAAGQFLPGDLVKAVVAALITGTVVRAYPPIETAVAQPRQVRRSVRQ